MSPFDNLNQLAVVTTDASPQSTLNRVWYLKLFFGAKLTILHPTAEHVGSLDAAPCRTTCSSATLLVIAGDGESLVEALEVAIERAPNLPVWAETPLSQPWEDRLLEAGVPYRQGSLCETIAHARGRGPAPEVVEELVRGKHAGQLVEGDPTLWSALLDRALFDNRSAGPELIDGWRDHHPDLLGWLDLWDHHAEKRARRDVQTNRSRAGWVLEAFEAHSSPAVRALGAYRRADPNRHSHSKPWFAHNLGPATELARHTRPEGGLLHLRLLAEAIGAAQANDRPYMAAELASEAQALLPGVEIPAGLPHSNFDRSMEMVGRACTIGFDLDPTHPDHSASIPAERTQANPLLGLIRAIRLLEERKWWDAWNETKKAMRFDLRSIEGLHNTDLVGVATRILGGAAIGGNATREGLDLIASVADAPASQLLKRRPGTYSPLDDVVWWAHAGKPSYFQWKQALIGLDAELAANQVFLGRRPLAEAIRYAAAHEQTPAEQAVSAMIRQLQAAKLLELRPGVSSQGCVTAILAALEEAGSPSQAPERVGDALIREPGVLELYADDATLQRHLVRAGLV